MEDEYQSTLKKKISILFQLGKWPDVVKLCESYTEKYGKDMELDLMRFKSERHLGISASPPKNQGPETKKPAFTEKDQPLVLDDEDAVDDDSIVFPVSPLEEKQTADDLKIPESAVEELSFMREDKIAYDPSADDNDLIITDPFEENEPGFSLAADEPPVILSDRDESENVEIASEPVLEMADPGEDPDEFPKEEIKFDFKNLGSITIDADPQLTPDTPKKEPSAAGFGDRERMVWDDPGRSTSGGSEFLEEPPEEIPSPKLATDEEPEYDRGTFHEISEKMPPIQKRDFPFKLLLGVVLSLAAAVLLWLVLSGKLNFSGDDAPAVDPKPVAKAVVAKQLPAAKKIPPTALVPAVVEKDKAFDEKFQQASELFKKGDLLKAWAVVLEAKKIKMTEPLRLLEEQLAAKIQADEARAKQESQVVQNQWQQESQAFAKAEAENTMAGWQNFLNTYPQGEFAFKAEKKIAVFKKKAQENVDQQLLLKIKQLQKTKLRSAYLSLGQADISALLRQSGKPPAQFETHEHGGAKVMLDFATGLMWNLWQKPMAYDKAKWWANRITAGYGGWRLPSTEEAVSLLQMDRAQYAGLAGFAVWSGDTVNDQSRTIWVLKLPEGQFTAAGYDQFFYVWAVRTAGK
ncbi:MAG: DUF1566 domain-containing protein [Acidobacteria bacterium]|nr:DUF1566 domain-containing protein [Acidobacteriota bacterium]MBU4307368.1 DUF1566 domain-containing protein [Acidobacteriota bacterium]MCG2811641.1 DUF1566 domain-containing protein [Candidatus Aminicenantes bacterium]